MRFSNIAFAAAVAGSAQAQSTPSLCNKYTAALLTNNTAANQYTVLTLLVKTAVLGNFTGAGSANPTLPGSMVAVPGILAAGTYGGVKVNLAQYFDGSLESTNRGGKAVALNFLDGGNETLLITEPTSIGNAGSNQATLITHLIEFFGALLGCSEYGMTGFSAYAGNTNMGAVHMFMDLSAAENNYFIEQVGLAAESFGVTAADATTVGMALNSTFGYRCALPAAVIPGSMNQTQVICQGAGCPIASPAQSGCSGSAAFAGFTATSAPPATATSGSSSATGSSAAGSSAAGSSAAASGSAASASGSGNAAPKQTAAAGLMAAAGLAALFL